MARISIPKRAPGTVLDGYIMGPRINMRRDVAVPQIPSRTIWNMVKRDSKNCHAGSDYNTCEKGINTNITNLAIILGVVYVEGERKARFLPSKQWAGSEVEDC